MGFSSVKDVDMLQSVLKSFFFSIQYVIIDYFLRTIHLVSMH